MTSFSKVKCISCIPFQHSSGAHTCGRNRALAFATTHGQSSSAAFATTHEQSFLLPRYRGISDSLRFSKISSSTHAVFTSASYVVGRPVRSSQMPLRHFSNSLHHFLACCTLMTPSLVVNSEDGNMFCPLRTYHFT